MRILIHSLVILGTLLAFGVAKLRYEDQLNQDMVKQQLIQPPMKKGTNLEIGQTGAAVALGGLRSLVAAVWNLRAFLHFENLDWIKLEQAYGVITTLQPQTTHYWETGAWHLHTNASVHYKENNELPPFRRNSLRQQYINKGSNFLEEGVRQNPDNWQLHNALASVWSDHTKLPDLNRAVRHYDDLLACQSLPEYRRSMFERFRFYTMTRIPERYEESLQEGTRLFHASPQNRRPSMSNYIFALQNALDIPESERIPDTELFPNKKVQLQWLINLWNRRKQDFPVHGVMPKIEELKSELNVSS